MNPRLGVDLAGLDLQTTLQGDFALVDDRENVRAAIFRRLDTPRGGLFTHPWYGNPLHNMLSEPIDSIFEGKAKAAIRQCLSQEPRIELTGVDIMLHPEERLAVFIISYIILGEPGPENLVWEVPLQ